MNGLYSGDTNKIGFELALSRAASSIYSNKSKETDTKKIEYLFSKEIPSIKHDPILKALSTEGDIQSVFDEEYKKMVAVLVSIINDDRDSNNVCKIAKASLDIIANKFSGNYKRGKQVIIGPSGPYDYLVLKLLTTDKGTCLSEDIRILGDLYSKLPAELSLTVESFTNAISEIFNNEDRFDTIMLNYKKLVGRELDNDIVDLLRNLNSKCKSRLDIYKRVIDIRNRIYHSKELKDLTKQTTDIFSIPKSSSLYYDTMIKAVQRFDDGIQNSKLDDVKDSASGIEILKNQYPSNPGKSLTGLTFLRSINFDIDEYFGKMKVGYIVGDSKNIAQDIIDVSDAKVKAICTCGQCGSSFVSLKSLVEFDASLDNIHQPYHDEAELYKAIKDRHNVNIPVCPHCGKVNMVPQSFVSAIITKLRDIYERNISTETKTKKDAIMNIYNELSDVRINEAVESVVQDIFTDNGVMEMLGISSADDSTSLDSLQNSVSMFFSNGFDNNIKQVSDDEFIVDINLPVSDALKYLFEFTDQQGIPRIENELIRPVVIHTIFDDSDKYNKLIDIQYLPAIKLKKKLNSTFSNKLNSRDIRSLSKGFLIDQDKFSSRFEQELSLMSSRCLRESTNNIEKLSDSNSEEILPLESQKEIVGSDAVNIEKISVSYPAVLNHNESLYYNRKFNGMFIPHNINFADTTQVNINGEKISDGKVISILKDIYSNAYHDGFGNITLTPSKYFVDFVKFISDGYTNIDYSLKSLKYTVISRMMQDLDADVHSSNLQDIINIRKILNLLNNINTEEDVKKFNKLMQSVSSLDVSNLPVIKYDNAVQWILPNGQRDYDLNYHGVAGVEFSNTLKAVDLFSDILPKDDILKIILGYGNSVDSTKFTKNDLKLMVDKINSWYPSYSGSLNSEVNKYFELLEIDDINLEVLDQYLADIVEIVISIIKSVYPENSSVVSYLDIIDRNIILSYTIAYCMSQSQDMFGIVEQMLLNKFSISDIVLKEQFELIRTQMDSNNTFNIPKEKLVYELFRYLSKSMKYSSVVVRGINLSSILLRNALATKNDELSSEYRDLSVASTVCRDLVDFTFNDESYIQYRNRYSNDLIAFVSLKHGLLDPMFNAFYNHALSNTMDAADFKAIYKYNVPIRYNSKGEASPSSTYEKGIKVAVKDFVSIHKELNRIDNIICDSSLDLHSKAYYIVIRNQIVNMIHNLGWSVSSLYDSRDAGVAKLFYNINKSGNLNTEIMNVISMNLSDMLWANSQDLNNIVSALSSNSDAHKLLIKLNEKYPRDNRFSQLELSADLECEFIQCILTRCMEMIFVLALNIATDRNIADKITYNSYSESTYNKDEVDNFFNTFNIILSKDRKEEISSLIQLYEVSEDDDSATAKTSMFTESTGLFDNPMIIRGFVEYEEEMSGSSESSDSDIVVAGSEEIMRIVRDKYNVFDSFSICDIACALLDEKIPCNRELLYKMLSENNLLKMHIKKMYIFYENLITDLL